mmetsp:Transcript_120703/g.348759  ORF Transcript_120703/g.348759 Transcript_120703/m.348759 type:complete len:432 (+) Transcript_120703:378-1673(+)
MELAVKRGDIVDLVRAAEQPVEKHTAELRLQQEHLVDGLANDFSKERVQLVCPIVRPVCANRWVQSAVRRLAKETELRIEHGAIQRQHELLEEAAPIHTPLRLAVRADELHPKHVAERALIRQTLEGGEAVLDEEVPADLMPLHRRLCPRAPGVPSLRLVVEDDVVQQLHTICEGQDVWYVLEHRLEHLLGVGRCTACSSGAIGLATSSGRRLRGLLLGNHALVVVGLHGHVSRDAIAASGVLIAAKVDDRCPAYEKLRLRDDPRALARQDRSAAMPIVQQGDQRRDARTQGSCCRLQRRLARQRCHEVVSQAVQEDGHGSHLLDVERVGGPEELVVVHRLHLQRVDRAEDAEPHRLGRVEGRRSQRLIDRLNRRTLDEAREEGVEPLRQRRCERQSLQDLCGRLAAAYSVRGRKVEMADREQTLRVVLID